MDWEALIEQPAVRVAGTWLGVAVAAWVAYLVTRHVLVRVVRALIQRSRFAWDDVLVEHRVFARLSLLAPAVAFHVAATVLLTDPEQAQWAGMVRRLAIVWMILAGARSAHAALDAAAAIGSETRALKGKPLRSYVQVLELVLWLGVGILTIATLIEKSPWALLTGLGAMTAILLLVFKDTILGFVASLQIAGNDMIRVGDWVEMPKYGADGDVIEIGLHTVKIRNWDKTVSTIPTYNFITDAVKNWRGMSESGGRRIKRSVSLDMTSVSFLDHDDLERLRRIQYIADYLEEKAREVDAWNGEHGVDDSSLVNGRRLTNLGTFRAYVESYLRHHPEIRQDMTFLVRQLPPGPEGLPLEVYVFSGEQRWVQYEAIVGDVFDHLLAVIPEFGLRVYQRPSGADLRALAGAVGAPDSPDGDAD